MRQRFKLFVTIPLPISIACVAIALTIVVGSGQPAIIDILWWKMTQQQLSILANALFIAAIVVFVIGIVWLFFWDYLNPRKVRVQVAHVELESVPGRVSHVDPQDEIIAINLTVTLTPTHKMQWAKIWLTYEDGVLEGKVRTITLPHYLESAETHDVVFNVLNTHHEGVNWKGYWLIQETRKIARKEPRSQGIVTIRADGKLWKSEQFPIPTELV